MHEGIYIKLECQKAGLTQKELAEKAGLATITIQQYERNLRAPRLENLKKIAHALNIPTEALFGDISIAFMTDLDEEKLNFLLENKSEQLMQDWNTLYKQLNDAGKAKAIEHLELLTKIPEYRLDNGSSKNAVSPPNTINAKAPDCSYRDEEELLAAAHARTDVEQTSEDVQHDLDIMNDDSKWNK